MAEVEAVAAAVDATAPAISAAAADVVLWRSTRPTIFPDRGSQSPSRCFLFPAGSRSPTDKRRYYSHYLYYRRVISPFGYTSHVCRADVDGLKMAT